MTVDFAALRRDIEAGREIRPPRRERVFGKWPKRGVTFDVERGSFDISKDIVERATLTGDDFEIRREFARHLAPHEDARPYRYEKRGGGLRVYWRSIRVVKDDGADRRNED